MNLLKPIEDLATFLSENTKQAVFISNLIIACFAAHFCVVLMNEDVVEIVFGIVLFMGFLMALEIQKHHDVEKRTKQSVESLVDLRILFFEEDVDLWKSSLDLAFDNAPMHYQVEVAGEKTIEAITWLIMKNIRYRVLTGSDADNATFILIDKPEAMMFKLSFGGA